MSTFNASCNATLDSIAQKHNVQVLLRHMPDREPLVYACSWWKAGEVGQYLKDSSKPIWVSLSQERMELHRDIQFITLGHSPKLEE